MSQVEFNTVIELALQLPPAEQVRLMERLAASVYDTFAVNEEAIDETPWTDEELANLTKIEPMTGAEIIAAGLTGTWADMNISDGGDWVNEQKHRRKEKRRW